MKEIFNDLLTDDANLKGLIGEILAKKHIIGSFKPNRHNLTVVDDMLGKNKIDQKTANFLKEYWGTIDIIRVKDASLGGSTKVEIFEVKAKKFYHNFKASWLAHKVTPRTIELYNKCLSYGIDFKFAYVVFFSDWKYRVKIKEFNPKLLSTDDRDRFRKYIPVHLPSLDVY